VLEAAVIGVADAEGLTKTKAFVVLKGSETVRRRATEGPASYKRQIEFVAECPKDKLRALQIPAPDRSFAWRRPAQDLPPGKIQRFKLRGEPQAQHS
jgi:hypothetical protein